MADFNSAYLKAIQNFSGPDFFDMFNHVEDLKARYFDGDPPKEILKDAFSWRRTPEGWVFWQNLSDSGDNVKILNALSTVFYFIRGTSSSVDLEWE